jgi:HSP70 co-chaperone SNL1
MSDLKQYLPYGVSTLLVLSSVAIYYYINYNKSGAVELSPVAKIKAQLDKFTQQYESYVSQVESYYREEFNTMEDQIYRCNYFQEELLKLLISLDGVDLLTVDDEEVRLELKGTRKGLIKQIQLKQKELDQFQKEKLALAK